MLLQKNPEKRLGSESFKNNNGLLDIKQHEFFTNFEEYNIDVFFGKYFKKLDDNQRKELGNEGNDLKITKIIKTIKTIKEGIVDKKSPWFHYNTRKIVLDTTPKIEYIDPYKNKVKGVIYLTKSCRAVKADSNKFNLNTPKRNFLFRTTETDLWVSIINSSIDTFYIE